MTPSRNDFSDYRTIFWERGRQHDQAITSLPYALQEELELLLEMAAIESCERVLEIGASGGYMMHHSQVTDLHYTAVDTCPVFYEILQGRVGDAHLAPLSQLPFADNQFDAVLCQTGLHHEKDKLAIFSEAHRVLAPGGRFVIAEVADGTATADFLNEFVHGHNPMGHHGIFVDDEFWNDLKKAGFSVTRDEHKCFHWNFCSVEEMAGFLKLLFGVELASEEQIVSACRDGLGLKANDGKVKMNWSLQNILGVKNS